MVNRDVLARNEKGVTNNWHVAGRTKTERHYTVASTKRPGAGMSTDGANGSERTRRAKHYTSREA